MFTLRITHGFLNSDSSLFRFDTIHEAVVAGTAKCQKFHDTSGHHFEKAEIYFVNEEGSSEDLICEIMFSSGLDGEQPHLDVKFKLDGHMYATIFGGMGVPQPKQLTPREKLMNLMVLQNQGSAPKQLR